MDPRSGRQPALRREEKMPGQSGTETRQKSAAITIRMLPEDHQALAARADAAGLSLADLVRSQVFDRTPDFAPRKQRVPTGAEVALAKILRELTALKAELGKIGSNVNQLAHRANAGERVSRAPTSAGTAPNSPST